MGLLLGGPYADGGGAPAAPSISLRSAGSFYRSDIDGFDVDIPLATRVAGDQLFVAVTGPVSTDATQAGWTRTHAYTNNRLQVFTRVATADANDAFHIPAGSGGIRVAQMAAFQHSGFVNVPPDFLQNVQSGGLQDGSPGDASWDTLGISDPNLYSNTLVLSWAVKFRTLVGSAGMSLTPPYPGAADTEIGSITFHSTEGGGTRFWFTWGYSFQDTDAAISGANITYAPSESSGIEVNQLTRWEFNP